MSDDMHPDDVARWKRIEAEQEERQRNLTPTRLTEDETQRQELAELLDADSRSLVHLIEAAKKMELDPLTMQPGSDGGDSEMTGAIKDARESFAAYAGMDAPELPGEEMSALQVKLARWQSRNFGGARLEQVALGVAEEAGELCHSILKHSQGIRGMEGTDALREKAGDAIADCAIYLIQAATLLRLDFSELVLNVAADVMERDWVANPGDAHEVAG